MKSNIAVILKESLYDKVTTSKASLVNADDLKQLKKSHIENQENQELLINFLEQNGFKFKTFKNSEIKSSLTSTNTFMLDEFNLVISAGGDGTYLHSAFHLKKAHLIGFNSSPNFSVGFYCIREFEELRKTLIQYSEGKADEFLKLIRIEAAINQKVIPLLSLNDILFTNLNPSSSTDYKLEINGKIEQQSSSGIWISTPSGSSGAISAAGGLIDSIENERFQYLVRETDKAYSFKHGFLKQNEELCIHSLSNKNAIYIDGNSKAIEVSYGDRIRIKISDVPLITRLSN